MLSALVWYYTETNRLSTAIAYFERIKNKGSSNPETFRNGGIAYDRAGEPDKAIECFKTALELHHNYDEVRELLSDLYIATDKPQKRRNSIGRRWRNPPEYSLPVEAYLLPYPE